MIRLNLDYQNPYHNKYYNVNLIKKFLLYLEN